MSCENDIDTNHIRVLPDACVELFVNYSSSPIACIGNEWYSHSIVSFRMSKYTDVQMRKGSGYLAVCFYPGMASRFFHLPMHNLSDQTLALSDLWQGKEVMLERMLVDADNDEMRVMLLQKYLLQHMLPKSYDPQIVYCLMKIAKSTKPISVNDLTHDVNLSQRHLSRKFQDVVGLSPKEYLKVNRFIRCLDHLKKHPLLSLTEVAYKSGYYDQAHFNRDFKVFTGCTPKQVVLANQIIY